MSDPEASTWYPADSPSERFDAVLFDFGGVLADGPFESFARYEAENGLPDGFVRGLNTKDPDINAWARLERGEVTLDEFADLFEAEALLAGGAVDARAIISNLRGELRPRMLEAVRRCKEHFKTGLLTNNFVVASAAASLENVFDLFDAIVESSAEGVRKPDPRFYEIACERISVAPSRAIFLDDLGQNLKPARALGMTTIKVTDPDKALSELQDLVGIALT